jgi:hypothetical protein
MQSLLRTNLQMQQQKQAAQMSTADSMRQTTMTQAYDPPPPQQMAINHHQTPLPPHISSVPPGYHYYESNGNSYFLNLSTTEKVDLGPVIRQVQVQPTSAMAPLDLEATDSFVTPSAKKRKARGHSRVASRESTEDSSEDDDNYTYVRRRKKIKSKSKKVVTQHGPEDEDDAIVVMHETCDNQHVQVLEVDSSEDLPKTGHFGATFDEKEELTVTSGGSASDTLPEKQLRSSQDYKESQNLLESSTDSSDDDFV